MDPYPYRWRVQFNLWVLSTIYRGIEFTIRQWLGQVIKLGMFDIFMVKRTKNVVLFSNVVKKILTSPNDNFARTTTLFIARVNNFWKHRMRLIFAVSEIFFFNAGTNSGCEIRSINVSKSWHRSNKRL